MILNFLIIFFIWYLVIINVPNIFNPFFIWLTKKLSVGKEVYKKSGELFKSGKEFNIVKNVIILTIEGDNKPTISFIFEDGEIVPIRDCRFKEEKP